MSTVEDALSELNAAIVAMNDAQREADALLVKYEAAKELLFRAEIRHSNAEKRYRASLLGDDARWWAEHRGLTAIFEAAKSPK